MNSSFSMTSNRRAILLNFSLLCLMTIISYVIFQDLLMTFLGGLFSSFVLRVFFSKGNMREFGKSKTITASNGKVFSRKHKWIVVSIMTVFLLVGWCTGVLLKDVVPDFLTEVMALFIFQIPVKLTLFILDLPIGTFQNVQENSRIHNVNFLSSPSTEYSYARNNMVGSFWNRTSL